MENIKKGMKQYNRIFLWGMLIILVLFLGKSCTMFLKGSTNEIIAKESIPMISGEAYRQELIIDRNMSITDISLLFATYARENSGTLHVSLYRNELVEETWEIDVSQLGDYEYYDFHLTEGLKVGQDDKVYIELSEIYEGDNAVALLMAENVETSLYKGEELLKNRTLCYEMRYSESIIDFGLNYLTQILIAVFMTFAIKMMWDRCRKTDKGCMVTLLVLVSTIFVLLYFPYITGEKVYVYADMACDTVDQYWPKYHFYQDFLRNIGNEGYTLQWGLGKYINQASLHFLNPFDWSFFFVDAAKALLVSLYLKIIWTGTFSWLYFRKKFQHKETALICTILWTFAGWFVAWGQHYAFAKYYAYFTAILFCMELLIEKSKYIVLLPIMLAILTGNNYYFTYMIGIFCVLYLIFTGVIKKWKIKELFWNVFKLGIAEIIALFLSIVQLYPTLDGFLHSSRTEALNVSGGGLFRPRDLSYLIAYVGRMLSTNMWGLQKYTGPYNYYEMAISYSSILLVVAIVYFMYSKAWKKMSAALLGYVVLIMLPIVSKMMQFAENSYRWTFLLNVGAVLLIGFFIEKLRNDVEIKDFSRIYKVTSVFNIVMVMLLCVILCVTRNNSWELEADIETVAQICIIWAVLDILVLILKITKCNSWEKIVSFLILFVCIEQLFMNYYVVNERVEISSYALENGYYNDGTIELVDELETIDDSLYRINKTYDSVFYNDAYIQGYNGVSIYDSVNGAFINEFIHNLDIPNLNNESKYISIEAKHTYVNELLAVKYLIAENNTDVGNGFVEIMRNDDLVLYEDTNALPFGYLYASQLDAKQYDALEGTVDKSAAMMIGFYTDEIHEGFSVEDLSNVNLTSTAEIGREKLKNTKIYNVVFEDDTYSASIVNDSGGKGVLCVPLIYDNRWKASLDGQAVQVFNINSGLIGVEVPNGEHTIEIVYNTSDYDVVQIVSMVSWCIYVVFLICWLRKRNMIKNTVQM